MATDFGRDLWCDDSLRTGRFVTGIKLLGQAIFRRLTTPRGSLRGGEAEANYGLDLVGLLGSGDVRNLVASLPDRIRLELVKDERIADVTAIVDATYDGPKATLAISIAVESSVGPFTLKLSVNDVTAELLGILEAA
jgi:hypothetical protein